MSVKGYLEVIACYKYTCTACGFERYGDHMLSMLSCKACPALAFGLQRRERMIVQNLSLYIRKKKEMNAEIMQCEGFKSLVSAVEVDENKSPGFHDYRAKLDWIVQRAQHYAEKTGLQASEILNAWENNRNYWYMNYYQDSNMPELSGNNIKTFETMDVFLKSIGNKGFRCPLCEGVSASPYECNSGLKLSKGQVCDWKSYGLLKTLGKGAYVFVKSEVRGESLFMPIAWEKIV